MTDSTPTALHTRLCYLEAALDQVDEAIVWTDAAGTVQSCNATFKRLVNSAAALENSPLLTQLPLTRQGKPISLTHHPVNLARTSAPSGKECYELDAGDRRLEITWSPLPVVPTVPQPLELPGTVFVIRELPPVLAPQPTSNQLDREIMELVETRQALETSEERLRLALEAADMGIWDLDLMTGKETWSTRTEAIFGFAPGTFTGSHELFLSRIHPEDRQQVWEKHAKALQTSRYHNEFRVIHPDGSLHWVETWGKVFYDATGIPIRVRGVDMDVTELKQAEEALRLREQAIVASSNGIIITDARQPDMPIVYVNPAFERQTGYRADEVLSRNCRFLQCDDRHQPELDQLRQAVQTGTSCTITLRNYRKDGSLFWNQLSISPIFDANQTLTHFVGIQTDVSDRKHIEAERIRTEAALRQSETHLAESQRIARLGNWQYDLMTQKITWSEEVFRIYRLDPTQPEPTYEEFLQYAQVDDQQQFIGLVQRAIEQAEPYESDFRIIRADGSTGYVFAKGQPILDSTGQVTHLFGIIMDISDRKQVEAELLRQKEYLRLILDNIPQQVFWKDINLVFQGCNKHWAEAAFLDSPAVVIGKTDYDLLPNQEIAEVFRQQDLHIMTTNTPQLHLVAAKQRPGKDGQTIWLDISKIPVHDADNNVIGIVGVLEDITERKLAEEQIKASLQEKEVLLKEIHHRVKNNLQMVFSLLSLQTSTIQDEGIRAAIKDTQNRVKAMALIHEKLYQSTNLSKIRFAEYVQQLTLDLVRSYRSITSMIDLDLQIDDVELTIDTIIPCGLIISELVSNAMKYAFKDGRQGQVRVSFFREITGQYQLEVADNGIGIPDEIDFRNTQSLGMQLVCAFTTQLRGTIELDRTNGSIFRITFDTLL